VQGLGRFAAGAGLRFRHRKNTNLLNGLPEKRDKMAESFP
jgi:hypothetical protein